MVLSINLVVSAVPIGMVAVLVSKSFRDFIEEWGFMFMILSVVFLSITGWLVLWMYYELVTWMLDKKSEKKATKEHSKKKKPKKKEEQVEEQEDKPKRDVPNKKYI